MLNKKIILNYVQTRSLKYFKVCNTFKIILIHLKTIDFLPWRNILTVQMFFRQKLIEFRNTFVKLLNIPQNCTQKFIYKDSTLESWSQVFFFFSKKFSKNVTILKIIEIFLIIQLSYNRL